jgi:ABC-type bacteriocin/lantibiotic exporter with double-glycine peptidase domain
MADFSTPTPSPIRRFIRLLSLDIRDLRYIYFFGIFNGIIALSLPLGVQALMNLVIGGRISASWGVLLFLLTVGVVINGVFNLIQININETLQTRLFARIALDFSYRIPRFRSDALDKVFAPEVVNRFFDTLTIQKGLSKILIDCTAALLQMFFALLLLSFYHVSFFVLGLGMLLFLGILIRFTFNKSLESSIYESKYKYKVVHWLEELARSLTSFKTVSSNLPMEKTDALLGNYMNYRGKHFRFLAIQYSGFIIFKAIVTAGMLGLGTMLVMDNTINLGEFVAAEIVTILIIGSVEKIILSLETIFDVLTAIDKIGSVTDIPLEPQGSLMFNEVDTQKGIAIQINHLKYQYLGSDKLIINDLSLSVAANERLCISGKNGSGKRTLLHLIAGFFPPQTGTINYNDIPLGNLHLDTLRNYIGNKIADDSLFEGSLRENITVGRKDITTAEIIETLKDLGLLSFMQSLPEGLETIVLPEGKTLGRHTIARILLARSIVGKPRLLLLENLMQDLDETDFEAILSYLLDKKHNYTLIIASNDPRIQQRCDRVVQL